MKELSETEKGQGPDFSNLALRPLAARESSWFRPNCDAASDERVCETYCPMRERFAQEEGTRTLHGEAIEAMVVRPIVQGRILRSFCGLFVLGAAAGEAPSSRRREKIYIF